MTNRKQPSKQPPPAKWEKRDVRRSLDRPGLFHAVGERIREEAPSIDNNKITYMARPFVQATLPHRDPGKVVAWSRSNGHYSMNIQPGVTRKNGELQTIGLPFGSIPRLLLFWATEEVLKTQSRRLVIGQSLAEFMTNIGLDPSKGGPRSDAARLKEQVIRLFSSNITFTKDTNDEDSEFSFSQMPIGEKIWLNWDTKRPTQDALFDSEIILSEGFFQSLQGAPVPLDTRILAELKQSPLALDIYAWLTFRVAFMEEPTLVTYEQILSQIGAEYGRTRDFKAKLLKYLKPIYLMYPDLDIEERPNGLYLKPSRPSVPIRSKKPSEKLAKR